MMLFSLFERAQLKDQTGATDLGIGRRLIHGRLDLEFASDPEARTYLAHQYANHPFHVCRVQFHDSDLPGLATLYMQSCSGGVYEDDRLDIRIVGRACAEAHISSQSSTVVHSMPSGWAQQHARIEAQNRSYLEYLPDPQILFPNSNCSSTISVCVASDATALVSIPSFNTILMAPIELSRHISARSELKMMLVRRSRLIDCNSTGKCSKRDAPAQLDHTPPRGHSSLHAWVVCRVRCLRPYGKSGLTTEMLRLACRYFQKLLVSLFGSLPPTATH